jgi:Ca-activated chloride channel family protein
LYPQAWGRVATVSMRWQDPDTREVIELAKDFDTHQLSERFHRADPHFQWSVVVAEYAEILRESYWAEDNSIDAVYEEAQRVSETLPRDEAVNEFVELVRRARRLMD